MTLEDLLFLWNESAQNLAEIGDKYNKVNKKRREIEAQYMVDWNTKAKSEALFINKHSDVRDSYQERKIKFVYAETREKQLSKLYYQARDWQGKWDLIDSAISQIVNDM